MIGFADSHDVEQLASVGLENERTTREARIQDPNNHNITSPYAHWFSRPLEIHPGERYLRLLCPREKVRESDHYQSRRCPKDFQETPGGIQDTHIRNAGLLIEGDRYRSAAWMTAPICRPGLAGTFLLGHPKPKKDPVQTPSTVTETF